MSTLPHAAAKQRAPRLANRKLTEGETENALRYLREYVRGKRAPARMAANALRCSLRTAERLLSVGVPFSGRLKRRYVVNMSLGTGIPLEKILRTCWREYQDHLGGWMDIQLPSMAVRAAAELASGLSMRAQLGYNVRCDYSVTHGVDGRPAAVEARLHNLAGHTHTLEFKESALYGGLHMLYITPRGLVEYNGQPSARLIENIMCIVGRESKKIAKNEQKDIATITKRAVPVHPPKKRGSRSTGDNPRPEGA